MMCEYFCSEGTYLIPKVGAETSSQFSCLCSPFFKHQYDVTKIICNEDKSDIEGFEFELRYLDNTQSQELTGIFIGVYRIGEKEPIWHQVVNEECSYKEEMMFRLDDMKLTYGDYFILLGNIKPDGQFSSFIKYFAGCYRLDFRVLPNGRSLKHPKLLDYKMRYIAPDERTWDFPYHYPNYLMMIGGLPLYELTVKLDSAPDEKKDKYDLRIFDEGLCCTELIEDVFHHSIEKLLFVPPLGVAHGVGHYILYHNETPFIHFQCNRQKRMGVLKAENISPDSIYWHLHKYKSLQMYGCRSMKKKICELLNNQDEPTPQCLCIIDDEGDHELLPAILNDLYNDMSCRYLYDDNYESLTDACMTDIVIVWNLNNSSKTFWKKWVAFILENITTDNKVVIYGSKQHIKLLFEKFENLSQLVPSNCRWQKQPYTKMENLYRYLNALLSEGYTPRFEEYERLYNAL